MLYLSVDIDMLLMVEKGVRGGKYITLIIDMQKLITNALKDYDKYKELPNFEFLKFLKTSVIYMDSHCL